MTVGRTLSQLGPEGGWVRVALPPQRCHAIQHRDHLFGTLDVGRGPQSARRALSSAFAETRSVVSNPSVKHS
jgi:hypothetical protein